MKEVGSKKKGLESAVFMMLTVISIGKVIPCSY